VKHPLQQYLEETGDGIDALARRVGAGPREIELLIEGGPIDDFGLAQRIVLECAGALTLSDLLGENAPADLSARRCEEPDLDTDRLRDAISWLLACYLEVDRESLSSGLLNTAAEAAANTHAALAGVTALRGPARLALALRPVLREILEDFGAPSPDAEGLAEAVRSACEATFRS
jgi:hypothetical protein